MDVVWLDVQMWTGLRGTFHPFTDVACEAPDPLPAIEGEWQRWASQYLGVVAMQEGWQAGRYAYSAERRDDGGHTLKIFARGQWQWNT
ncbi:hypothetical protein [Pseudonocardia nigra]|uniref:hypothetical protein n=1 Tax=Pseudonocardia nigra TaxID=1921578 RepID=UPI001FE3E418|nr:hypothetical protein [Pseudonocardia nigra]